jgi:nicotinamide phosphoribosyltransferase
MNPFLATDGYKTGHHMMYPEGTTLVYSNFTPRSNKYAPKGCDKVVSFGQQMVMKQIQEMFDEHFFGWDKRFTGNTPSNQKIKNKVLDEIKKEYSLYLGTDYDVSHIESLWDLGYLPLCVKALPEGSHVPMGVPVLTIYNTIPEFYWLTNFLETLISNLLWKPITSATIAHQYKKNLLSWMNKTDKGQEGFVEFQGHDFSMRGLSGIDSVISSGLGHATSFMGSDSLPVIHGARKYYGETDFVVGSVNATEHSVMCAGAKDSEIETFRYLMKQFPTGILSIVSDTWDLWKVLTEYLLILKEEILARDGKIVIRPDSGDPVDIICGTLKPENDNYSMRGDDLPETMGVIELLWEIFGGTTNEQGYKCLDNHIGAIYGDSITIERADEICKRLEAKGFASTNVVLGVGSFTYQFNTRDTFGFAMKATYVEVKNEKVCNSGACVHGNCKKNCVTGREIFKDPITDDGTKKSAKGLLRVDSEQREVFLRDQVSWGMESGGDLQTIFKDSKFFNPITLTEIRKRLNQ